MHKRVDKLAQSEYNRMHGTYDRIGKEKWRGGNVTKITLSEEEKETVIQFDESGSTATVYTASWNVARSLKRAGYKPTRQAQGAWWFEIPVHAVSIQGEKETATIG